MRVKRILKKENLVNLKKSYYPQIYLTKKNLI